jgi:hypothetical protein
MPRERTLLYTFLDDEHDDDDDDDAHPYEEEGECACVDP